MAFFGFGVFSTPTGQLVERATDNAASAGNIALHLEICDAINESDNGPKEAVAAIRKRLTGNSKNFHIINLTLTVLETCVKNCGIRFHSKIAQRDFLHDMMKVISVKNNPPTIVRERILGLVQYWADAFKGKHQLVAVDELYEQLKTDGIEFPPIDLDNLTPVETQGRSQLQLTEPSSVPPPSVGGGGSPHPPRQQQQQPQQPRAARVPSGPLKPEQVAKLLSELDVVRKNMDVMNEIMSEQEPGRESADDAQLLDDLNKILHSMHGRLAKLIGGCSDEIVLESTLVINDELNSLFVRYERWLRNSAAAKSEEGNTLVSSTGVATTSLSEPIATEGGGEISYPSFEDPPAYESSEQQLIDLGTEVAPPTSSGQDDIVTQLAQLGIISDTATPPAPPPPTTDEFDMFAQSRTASGEGSTYADNMVYQNASLSAAVHGHQDNPVETSNPYANLTDWLTQTDTKPPEEAAANTSAAESVTSAEFDQFLAQRANKGEGLPASRPRPQMQQAEERSDELFQL
ncbi:TOM1-like protein 2 [Halichondria panicea]|uniref:TOM1-like protein 2 n=1 Tax=Halichondria panicea TaxID=6063 RepID=UPI00312B4C03